MDALISELLYEYNCVIIPDFGGIVANKKGAELLKFSEKINPPRKRLAFNRSLTSNDGLLIDYVSRKKGYSYAEAERAVVAYVEGLKKSITDLKEAKIAQIGIFRKDYLDNIHFYPEMDSNFELSAFGLTTLPIKPIERIKASKQAALEELSKPSIEEVVRQSLIEKEEEVEVGITSKERESSDTSKIFMRVAAVLAGIFMISSFIINLKQEVVPVDNSAIVPLNNKPAEEKVGQALAAADFVDLSSQIEAKERIVYVKKEVEAVETITEELAFVEEIEGSITEVESIDEVVEMEEENLEESFVADVSPVTTPVTKTISTPEWSGMSSDIMIIVGSFRTKDNASTLLGELKAKGYQTDTISGPNGYTRVGVKFNTDQTNISAALNDVRTNVVKDAWLLE